MADLVSRLIGIILLRFGPQDLPAGNAPLTAAVVLYFAATGLSFMTGQPPENPLPVLVLATLLPLILVRIVLALRGRPARWAQTLTALFGTSALLSVVTLPLAAASGGSEPAAPVVLISLMIFIWSFAVDGHIWRHALEVKFATGLAVAVVLFAISLFMISNLAGPL